MKERQNKGFGIIEAITGMAIASLMLLVFISLITYSIKVSKRNISEIKAIMHLQEAIEISRDLEVSNWSEIGKPGCASPSKCHIESVDNEWFLGAGSETLEDAYSRSISVENVLRNQLDFPNEITTGSGIIDPSTKKIVAEIIWDDGFGPRALNLETYVYNPSP